LEFPGQLKLSTITEPGKVFKLNPYLEFIPIFYQLLATFGKSGFIDLLSLSKYKKSEILGAVPFVINKSSPHGP
jgi:hypothetical protein